MFKQKNINYKRQNPEQIKEDLAKFLFKIAAEVKIYKLVYGKKNYTQVHHEYQQYLDT
jgi:hypothetical protein